MKKSQREKKSCQHCEELQTISRRDLMRTAASGLLAGMPLMAPFISCARPGTPDETTATAEKNFGLTGKGDRKFIFVFGAMGGASINDSFLAVRQSDLQGNKGLTLNTFPDSIVTEMMDIDKSIRLRAVDLEMDAIGPLEYPAKGNQSNFLRKYGKDIMVVTASGTTVSHPVGQYRSVTGNDAWSGRTLQEAVAAHYGQGLLLPNVNMATLGFAENGQDPSLPPWAIAHPVQDTRYFPFSLHGHKGIKIAPEEKLVNLARQVRNEKLDANSYFMKTFGSNPMIRKWVEYRNKTRSIESLDLISRLTTLKDDTDTPFKDFGVEPNPRGTEYHKIFPHLDMDPLQRQALLAYLLVTEGLSCSVTMALDMNVSVDRKEDEGRLLTNLPTSFDYSHNAHRATQALLWNRILDTMDRLIHLLKATEYKDGKSYWDNSLIYIATEFGRDKTRESGVTEFTSGHNTNNGLVVVSPLVNGGRMYGGLDLDTLNTFGFDTQTGAPTPGHSNDMRDIYAGILHALEVDTKGSGLPDARALRRKA
jgi:hypothetical protein